MDKLVKQGCVDNQNVAETVKTRAKEKAKRKHTIKDFRKKLVSAKLIAKSTVEKKIYEKLIMGLIIINAILIGMDTYPNGHNIFGISTSKLSDTFGWVYIADIALRIFAYGRKGFFKNPKTEVGFWNWFDFIIVACSAIPLLLAFLSPGFNPAVLRTLRLARVLRLLTQSQNIKKVISGFVNAIPSMFSVIILMCLILFVFGVVASNGFGTLMPDEFGTLTKSMYSLFQVMTLESWSNGFARELSKEIPWAKAFFVGFILMTTFAVLNLLVALIVNSMQEAHHKEEQEEDSFEQKVLNRLAEIEKRLSKK